jgi:hypothetical protein
VTRYIPDRLVLLAIGLLALTAALWPAWSFLRVLPAIAEVYAHPLRPGWGFWLCTLSNLALAVYGLGRALTLPRR